MAIPRICVVGAGSAGMSTLIQLKFRQEEGCGPFDIVCFEIQPTWGGVWNYNWRTGLDENGEKVHAAMYNDLWTNGPMEINEFPDYTLLEHFKRPYPSHAPRAVCLDYIEGRFNKYDVKKYIEFNTAVRSVTFDDDTEKFTVVAEQVITKEKKTEVFDYVVVCTSYPSTPYTPSEIPGIRDIEPRIVHSHDLRNEFRNGDIKDKRILIIGGSYSAEDIILQCQKFGSGEIHMAYNRAPLGYVPAQEHPPIDHFEGPRTAHFKDGSKADFDLVIFCTGYVLDYSFMEEKLRLYGKTLFYHENLYKLCLWLKGGQNRLFYIGTHYPMYTMTLSEAQAILATKIIAKKVDLPTLDEMKENVKEWLAKWDQVPEKDPLAWCRFQTSCMNDLTTVAHFEYSMDAQKLWERTFACRIANLATHREQTYESLHTKTISVVPDIPFMDNFNDTKEDFMKRF